LRNWTQEWLFPGGKIHRERAAEYKDKHLVHVLCGLPIWMDDDGVAHNGEFVMPASKLAPAFIMSDNGRKYKVRYCKRCIELSRSERKVAV
jgi:hypothetical protein